MEKLNIIEILSIISIHFLGDFVLQTDKEAKGKSKNWNDLISHTTTYSLVWFFISWIYSIKYLAFGKESAYFIFALGFPLITFICHTITDYFTSRLNSKLWAKGDVHNFFVSVGFDQVLHYTQLFLTYVLLKQYI